MERGAVPTGDKQAKGREPLIAQGRAREGGQEVAQLSAHAVAHPPCVSTEGIQAGKVEVLTGLHCMMVIISAVSLQRAGMQAVFAGAMSSSLESGWSMSRF